ncbi:TPA: DUF1833 family protein [Providencia rettgeri]|nr:DUF1833 family protein [Providencia rettgeri]
MKLREYRAQRPMRTFYETIQFYHPSFGNIHLVSLQIEPKVLGGVEYQPCNFELAESQQSKTPIIDASVKFSRVAQDFKQQLKMWRSYMRMAPIVATPRLFDSADTDNPISEWSLYVKDCSLDAESVTVTLSMNNPLNKNVGQIYTMEEFTGLETV